MRVTKEVADILNLTFDEAIREHHEYVTPELLLYEIAARDTFREAFENCGGDTDMLRDNLREYMNRIWRLMRTAAGRNRRRKGKPPTVLGRKQEMVLTMICGPR